MVVASAPSKDRPGHSPHRRRLAAIFALLLALVGVSLYRFSRNSLFIDDPPLPTAAAGDELADRLDPNAATWEELASIPGLGEKKAQAIVAYRDRWVLAHPRLPAFTGPQDLRNIKGIGPATVANLAPYLVFPPTLKPPPAITK